MKAGMAALTGCQVQYIKKPGQHQRPCLCTVTSLSCHRDATRSTQIARDCNNYATFFVVFTGKRPLHRPVLRRWFRFIDPDGGLISRTGFRREARASPAAYRRVTVSSLGRRAPWLTRETASRLREQVEMRYRGDTACGAKHFFGMEALHFQLKKISHTPHLTVSVMRRCVWQ